MPRDPRDISLNAPEQQTRRILENEDSARGGSRVLGASGGAEGKAGENGRPAGLRYKFNTNTAESDPGSGKLKLNNAALGAATKLWISETDADENGLATLLATWDDSTNTVRGTITIRSIATGSDIATYNVTGAMTDKGTYDAFTIEAISTGGTFSNEEEITIEFSRAGDKGAEGKEGTEGKEGKAGTEGAPGASGTGAPLAVRLATAAALPAYTRTTNKLEANANGALPNIDGVAGAVNNLILLKNGAAGADNGVFKITKVGGGAEKWVMERYESMDTSAEVIPGQLITVAEGTLNHDTVYQLTTNATITLNTTALTFARISPRDFGIVEALPTSEAVKGDLCTYVADKTNGIYWQLIYDGEGEFPWKKIGGPAMFARSNEPRSLNNAAYTSLPTDPLSITVPLKGDYNMRVEAGINNVAAAREGHLSYAIGATAANDIWAIRNISAAQVLVSMSLETPQTGVAAGAKVEEKGKSTGEVSFSRRRLWVDAIRVG